MNTLFSLTRNTFRESLRDPLYAILLLCALVLIGLFPTMTLFAFNSEMKFVIDSSMSATFTLGLIAAVLCSSNSLNREMRNGTVLLLMSKPVNRISFIVSKMLGISSALIVFVFLCNLATIVAKYVATDQFDFETGKLLWYFGILFLSAIIAGLRNFYSGKSFSASMVTTLLVMLPIMSIILIAMNPKNCELSFIYAISLLFFSVIIMGAVSVLLATRFGLVVNLTVSFFIFVGGLVSSYLLKEAGDSGNFVIETGAKMFSLIIPNWQYFWMADAITSKTVIPGSYFLWNTLYTILYLVLSGYWASYLFDSRELASSIEQ
ncbi:ABC transporter permease subunit [Lentisphaerota bacterium WC36G]|nr:ABC transporter permease [Lentisphaerae bacterium WC36]